jgi:hypothetical protein
MKYTVLKIVGGEPPSNEVLSAKLTPVVILKRLVNKFQRIH